MADPEFPRGGGANPPGAPTYDFAKFPKNYMKLKEFEPRVWGGREGASKILLCRSATIGDPAPTRGLALIL